MEQTKTYLRHKTVDAIMDNNYHVRPVTLYTGTVPLHEEFPALAECVREASVLARTRLRIKVYPGFVKISKV